MAGSIHDQPKDTIRERKLYEKLKALNKYHKRNGVEAILYKKFKEKRQRSGATHLGPPKPSFQSRCIFTEGGVKCGDRIIPGCKYCRKHILEDKKQVLFRACNVEKGGVVCQEPVTNIFEDATCVLHIQLPAQRSYSQKKAESESEDETESSKLEASVATTTASVEIKTESSVVEPSVSAFATPDEIQPANSIDDLKVEEGETNLTFCHDTSSTTIVVVPKSTEEESAQSTAATAVNEVEAPAMNVPTDVANTLQPMEVDHK